MQMLWSEGDFLCRLLLLLDFGVDDTVPNKTVIACLAAFSPPPQEMILKSPFGERYSHVVYKQAARDGSHFFSLSCSRSL